VAFMLSGPCGSSSTIPVAAPPLAPVPSTTWIVSPPPAAKTVGPPGVVSPELRSQRHHRQRLKRHRDAVGAGDDRTLGRYPCNADDQRERRADAGDTQQAPPQARGIFGRFGHRGGRHKREEHQRAEQRHQRRHVCAAQQGHHDFQSAHA
jgi:hypothetical protein